MALFALDHNYPEPIINAARPYLSDLGIELAALADIDPRLPEFEDDWQILLALHHQDRDWDGMVTNDDGMLSLPTELAVLGYTRLTLVAPVSVGHDPVRATGLLLAHIVNIANRLSRDKPQVWELTGRTPPPKHPDRFFERMAERQGVDAKELREASRPPESELEIDPLA